MPEPEIRQARLESWKEIAAYLQRNVITVQRWEKQEGLPVHRHSHQKRSSVYAYAGEIDRWRESRKAAPPAHSIRRQLLTPSFALTLALCLVMAGNGVRPQPVEADAVGERRTLVCSGPDCAEKKFSPDVEALLVKGSPFSVLGKLRAALFGDPPYVQFHWVLSPDGSRVAYTRATRQNPYVPSGEIRVTNADGSGPPAAYPGGLPEAWSPDGSRLLTGSGESLTVLAWVDMAGGRTQKLPPHWNVLKPVVSPDGRYIAFSAGKDRDSLENVSVMASDGSGETMLSPNPAYQEPIGWMPDGKTLVYRQYSEPMTLWAASVVNGKLQGAPRNLQLALGKDAEILGISRTGALYYFTRGGHTDIYTASMDPATGKVSSTPVPLPVLNAGSNVFPKWAPDSRRLLFQSGDSTRGEQTPHIYSFDTGEERTVDGLKGRGPGLECWSRDGAALLYTDWKTVSRFDLSSRRITPLFTSKPVFSLSSCSGDWAAGRVETHLEISNLNTAASKTIYDPGPKSTIMDAAISHDGGSVAFTIGGIPASIGGGPKAIRIVSTDGGTPRDIVTAVAPEELQYLSLAWSPDDRFLYFTRRADAHSPFELYRVPAAAGRPDSMGLKLDGLGRIDIAPDGSRIALSAGSSGSELWAVQGFLPKR